jgi:predicted nuclease of predicted toxin-antitoxin system
MTDTSTAGVVWIDAQLPPALAHWLRQAHGVDARHVADVEQLGADDPAIFAAARAGRAAVVMTKDEDFVELVERHGPPPQVVWVTCGNVGNVALRTLILDAWPSVAALLAGGEPLVEIGHRV